MRYRRNSDSELRSLEREFHQSGDPALLISINLLRKRAGLAPHPAARISAARKLLGDIMCRGVAGQIREFVDVYLDPAMYIDDLEPDSQMRQEVINSIDAYQHFLEDWRTVSGEIAGVNMGVPEDSRYLDLLARYGLQASPLGPEVEISDAPEGFINIFSPHAYRSGVGGRLDNIEIVSRLVCQQAIRIFRKLLILGVVNVNQLRDEEPEMQESWDDYPLGIISNYLDQAETAMEEIDRATIGVKPSAEAIELFSEYWYGD